MTCKVKDQCTKAKYGKGIQRSEYQGLIIENKERIEKNQSYYRQRQAIVEHPYGTIKRQWGFSYIMTKKGKQRASADVGLMCIAYNLRRIINILGKKEFKNYLQEWLSFFKLINRLIWFHIVCFKSFSQTRYLDRLQINQAANSLIFNPLLIKTRGY